MNENTSFCLLMAIILVIPIAGVYLEKREDNKLKIEAIKSGLIQKIDPETKEPIWTKP